MTRFTYPAELSLELELALRIGPGDDGPEREDLEAAWSYFGEQIMGEAHPRPVGWRPWGWWVFEQGEDRPERDAEEVRLAELGELTDEEVAKLAEDANVARPRIGTPREHKGPNFFPDRRAVEVYERVCEVRRK
jgi:hypothetical protein